MDISTIITATLSSGIVSVGAARWLTTRIIDHRLAKDLKDHQAALDEKLAVSKGEVDGQVAAFKAQIEAVLRRDVDEYLGDRSAERQYRFEAQRRLYAAIGPLRFQLVAACAEFSGRVLRIGSGRARYSTTLRGYFGRSTTFRLLRILAVAELIERQIAYADFSVDPSTVELLRFKNAAYRCLSSSTVSLDHPNANWKEQVEHVFWDGLSIIADAMITNDGPGTPARVMRFDEFDKFVTDPATAEMIRPIPGLMEDFTIATKPILWIRFVALAQLCNSVVERHGPAIGIVAEPCDGPSLLCAANDQFVVGNHERYCHMLEDVVSSVCPPPVANA